MVIPDDVVLLLSGVPATGKSVFGRGLAQDHGFAHYDLENYPQGWPDQTLKELWDCDGARFVAMVKSQHRRVALDWGFPVHCFPMVRELRNAGAQLVWFDGDRKRAREVFLKRGGTAVHNFNVQVAAIESENYPEALGCVVVRTLTADGKFLTQREIEQALFP